MKVVVVGVVPPFRGGIAVTNDTICRNLGKNNEVVALSFSSLYPSFLYPGKSQKVGVALYLRVPKVHVDSVVHGALYDVVLVPVEEKAVGLK